MSGSVRRGSGQRHGWAIGHPRRRWEQDGSAGCIRGSFPSEDPRGGGSVTGGGCWNGNSSIKLTVRHIGWAGAEQHRRAGTLIPVGARSF